jgi:hypothetical protein
LPGSCTVRGLRHGASARFELRRPPSIRSASLAQQSRGATPPRDGGALDVRALPQGKNFWIRCCIRKNTKARRALSPCHSQLIARWGTCRKTRGTAQNRRPMPQPAELGSRRAGVVVDVSGTR